MLGIFDTMARKPAARAVAAVLAAALLIPAAWSAERRELEEFDKSLRQLRVLIEILDTIQKEYADPSKTGEVELLNGAIHGMVSTLDRYSVYMDPEESKEFNDQTTGTFSGLGIQIDIVDGWLTVIEPLPGTPAAKAGILGGDRIIEVNGESTKGIGILEAQKRLKGEPGTEAVLTVARHGEAEFLSVAVTREIIQTYAIGREDIRMLDQTTGYIRLRDFTTDATAELEAGIQSLLNQGMRSLILDLRDNVGGLLNVAIDICDLFIPKGEPIVSHRDRKNRVKSYYADRPPMGDFLLALLVNEFSASASEIVAGCVQDHRRGLIVGPLGHKTFGKGSVQTLIELDSLPGSSLKITTAKYHTPGGRSIEDENGLTPDLFAPVTDVQRVEIRRAGKIGHIPGRLLHSMPKNGSDPPQPMTVDDIFGDGAPSAEEGEPYDIELYTAYQALKGAEVLRLGQASQYSLANPGN